MVRTRSKIVQDIRLTSAIVLLTELGAITRFKNIDHLCSHCGLTPITHNSGATERIGGISRR
ncbi:transposase [Niabella sp. CC-SYL272]|uniref:transposase n=1 Tax=Niabella agricola TaxID=2891571 RepID=UPI00387358DD|nr:transposase [Niabella agricola]